MSRVSGNPSLLDTMRLWRKLGGTVSIRRRTGDAVFEHPRVGREYCNSRRKDTPRQIVVMLRRLVAIHREEA